MCLIAFAIDASPGCPLLLAANRDEFFERPTARLHRWSLPDGTVVLAGRDLRDGGTWLGVSETGRIAMLTNVRSGEPGSGSRSRGELPLRWLQSDLSSAELHAGVDPGAYGGFNLVVGDLRQRTWAWLSNCDPEHPHQDQGESLHERRLAPGVYGLSNASLDTPWPKSTRLKSAVVESLEGMGNVESETAWMQPLTRVLSDRATAADEALPDTGVPLDGERLLSSPFVSMTERSYGTRSSALLRVTPAHATQAPAGWLLEMHEWAHTPESPTSPHGWSGVNLRQELLLW